MKMPRFVNGYIDRHEKARWYFRRNGFEQVPLPGLPWSPEFMAAYEAAKAGQRSRLAASEQSRAVCGRSLFPISTASDSGRWLGVRNRFTETLSIGFCAETGAAGIAYGDLPAAGLRREHIVKLMAARADKPDSARTGCVGCSGR